MSNQSLFGYDSDTSPCPPPRQKVSFDDPESLMDVKKSLFQDSDDNKKPVSAFYAEKSTPFVSTKMSKLEKIKKSIKPLDKIIRNGPTEKRQLKVYKEPRELEILTPKREAEKLEKTRKLLRKILKEEKKAKKHTIFLKDDTEEAKKSKKTKKIEKYLSKVEQKYLPELLGESRMTLYRKAKRTPGSINSLQMLSKRARVDFGKLLNVEGEFHETENEKIAELINKLQKLYNE
jgi:hypothetical protein